MKIRDQLYTLFIGSVNIFCVITLLQLPASIITDVLTALCFTIGIMSINIATHMIRDYKTTKYDRTIEQLKIKLSVMTQERDSCIAHLDYHAKQPINK